MAARKYQKSWKILKENKIILVEVSLSKDERIIQKYASTYNRGIQKEKYLDTVFRSKYPNAILNSEIDLYKGQIRITLDLQNYNSVLEDL